MKRGITNITDAKRGITQISKIMRGTVLIWEKIVAAVGGLADYIARVLADYGVVENETQLDLEVDFTSQDYLDAIAIYNPNGGYRTGKIYDVRDTDNTSPNDLTVTGGGGTRLLADGTLEAVPFEMPKIDYSTGKAAFLIEPARTNNYTYYNSKAGLTVGGGTITDNVISAPHLTDMASKILESGTDSHGFYKANNVSANTTYVISLYVKKLGRRYIGLQSWYNTSFGAIAYFDLDNGTSVGTSAIGAGYSVTEPKIEVVSDGWYRISAKFISGKTLSYYGPVSMDYLWTDGNSYYNNYIGDSTKGFYFYGRQWELTSLTSLIQSNGTVTTRTAAEASITVPAGVTSIEEKVDGVVNTITTIPATYTMPNGAVEYVKFL